MNKLHAAGWDLNAPTPAQLKEFFAQVENGRITKERLQMLLRGEIYYSTYPTPSQKRARDIMGKNYFGVEEAIKHFGVNPTKQRLAALAEILYTEGTLEEYRDTYNLVAIFPFSILDIRGKVESKLFLSHEKAWYNKEFFAQERGEVGWWLIRKAPVPNSILKTWDEQQALLAKNEETPKARVMVYAIISHYLATGERLFDGIHVRCPDIDSGGNRVAIENCGTFGLDICYYLNDSRSKQLGVASARKFDA